MGKVARHNHDNRYSRLAFDGVSCYLSGSNQTIANNTNEAVTLTDESFDSHGYHSSADNTKFIIPRGKGGKYLIIGQIAHAADTNGTTRACSIFKNGTMRGQTYSAPNATFDTVVQAQALLICSPGDYIQLMAYQNSGASKGVVAGATESWMSMTYLGA